MGGSSRGPRGRSPGAPQGRSSADSSNVRHTMDQERPISDSTEQLQPPATNERFYPDMGHVGYPWAISFLLCGMVLLLAGFVMTVTIDATQFKLFHQSRDQSGSQNASVVGLVFLALGMSMIMGGIANCPLQQKRVPQNERMQQDEIVVQQDAKANPRRAWPWSWPRPWPLAAICFLGCILLLSGLVLVVTKNYLPLLPLEKSKALNRTKEIRTHLILNTWPAFLIMGGIILLGGIVNIRKHNKKLSNDSSAQLPTLAAHLPTLGNDSSAQLPTLAGPTSNPTPATTAPSRHRPRSGRHSRFSRLSASHDDPSASVPLAPNTHVTPTTNAHMTPTPNAHVTLATLRDSTHVAFAVGAGAVSIASDDSSPPPYIVGPILPPPSSSDAPPSYDAVVRQQSQTLPAYDALFVPRPKTEDETGESNAVGLHNEVLPTYEEATLGLSPK